MTGKQKILQAKKKIEENSRDWKRKASDFFSDCCNATNKFLHATEEKQYLFLRKITSDVLLDNKQLVVTHQFPFSGLLKKPGCQLGLPNVSTLRTYFLQTEKTFEPIFIS